MINAKRFNDVFGIYATELWAMPEKEFLEWLNAKADLSAIRDESLRINKAYDDGCKTGYEQARFDYEQKWIPVTEGLPEEFGEYLACRKNGTVEKMFYNPILTTRYPKGFSIVNNNFSWRQDNVTAWMPLPEPYNGDKE